MQCLRASSARSSTRMTYGCLDARTRYISCLQALAQGLDDSTISSASSNMDSNTPTPKKIATRVVSPCDCAMALAKQHSQYRLVALQMRSAVGQAEAAARSQMLLEETFQAEKQPVAAAVEHSFDPEELKNGVLALQAAVRRRFACDTMTMNATGDTAGAASFEERGAPRGNLNAGRAQNKGRGGGKGKGKSKSKPGSRSNSVQ